MAPPVAIGVDVGGTNLRAARVAADGTVLARARGASGPSTDKPLPPEAVPALANAVGAF